MREEKVCKFKPAPQCEPSSYPGLRPCYSYMFRGDHISEIDTKNTVSDIDELKGRILPKNGKCDRYLIVGYGSNANPPQLERKFQGESDKVHPVLRGGIRGYDAVYSSRITSKGYVPATITKSSDTMMEVWANLLNEAQLKKMDESERWPNTYGFVELDAEFVLENGARFTRVYAYVDKCGEFGDDSGKPIRIRQEGKCNCQDAGMTQVEIMQEFRKKLDFDGSDEEFASNVRNLGKRNCYNAKLCQYKLQTRDMVDVRCSAETISWSDVCIPKEECCEKCPDWICVR